MRIRRTTAPLLAGSHAGRPGPLGLPILMKLAKYACIIRETVKSSGVHSNTLFDSKLPIAYSISAAWTAPRGGGGRLTLVFVAVVTPPARPGTAFPIAAVIAGRGCE